MSLSSPNQSTIHVSKQVQLNIIRLKQRLPKLILNFQMLSGTPQLASDMHRLYSGRAYVSDLGARWIWMLIFGDIYIFIL